MYFAIGVSVLSLHRESTDSQKAVCVRTYTTNAVTTMKVEKTNQILSIGKLAQLMLAA